jgi:hypothetical protein
VIFSKVLAIYHSWFHPQMSFEEVELTLQSVNGENMTSISFLE